jgi:hypothetical protein
MSFLESAAQDLDQKVEHYGSNMKLRDLAEGQFRLMVFSAIQHPDDELRNACIEICKDAVLTAEVMTDEQAEASSVSG